MYMCKYTYMQLCIYAHTLCLRQIHTRRIHVFTASTHACMHMHRQMRHKFAYNASCTCTYNYIDIQLHMQYSRKCLHLRLSSMHIYICGLRWRTFSHTLHVHLIWSRLKALLEGGHDPSNPIYAYACVYVPIRMNCHNSVNFLVCTIKCINVHIQITCIYVYVGVSIYTYICI